MRLNIILIIGTQNNPKLGSYRHSYNNLGLWSQKNNFDLGIKNFSESGTYNNLSFDTENYVGYQSQNNVE